MSCAYIWRTVSVLLGSMLLTGLQAATDVRNFSGNVASKASSRRVEFDIETLKNRDIDPQLARYFADASRFSEGGHAVTLYVNDTAKGRAMATFDKEGGLIFTTTLLDVAQLLNPGSAEQEPSGVNAFFLKAYPATVVQLKPSKNEVRLIVPTDAFRTPSLDTGFFARGGSAVMLNYNLLGMNSEFAGGRSEFRSVDTVAGFNVGDWLVRSRQTYTTQNDQSRAKHLYAYAQKTFTGLKSTFQGGQISIANSLFSGEAITGVQLLPETALRNGERDSGAIVEGVAHSTARVEVRQNGALIHATVIPAGPFTLTGLPLLSGSIDLDVTVIEADGSRRSFKVPAASFGSGTQGAAPGYSVAAGQYRPLTGDQRSSAPNVITGSGTWMLNRQTNGSAGWMVADGYQAIGWAADHALTGTTRLGLRQALSRATKEGSQGTQIGVALNAQVTQKLNLSLSATHLTEGYRGLADTTYPQQGGLRYQARNRNQYTTSVNWSDPMLGGFSVSHAYSSQFNHQSTQRLTGSWSKSFGRVTASLNVEKNLGKSGPYGDGDAVYLSVTMPLGQGSFRTYVNQNERGGRIGSTYNEQVSDTFGYTLQAERDSTDREIDLSLSTQLLPRYARANLGYARNGKHSTTFNGSLNGAVVAHNEGVTFTPYEVGDTFSILSVGDVSGVKVITPQGPVWTDAGGRAVAPGLSAYRNNKMEITPKSLPRNIDIINGYKEIQVGRGSVSRVDFDVVTSRRVLMTVTYPDGRLLEKGLAVSDSKRQYITTSVDRGQVFLTSIERDARLTVSQADSKTCVLDFILAKEAKVESYFESINAVCRTAEEPSQ